MLFEFNCLKNATLFNNADTSRPGFVGHLIKLSLYYSHSILLVLIESRKYIILVHI